MHATRFNAVLPSLRRRATTAEVALLLCAATCALATALDAQQLPDTLFVPVVTGAAYAAGAGPRVMFDVAHGNRALFDGGYRPFVELLERDGFVVTPVATRFEPAALAAGDILVIINAHAAEKADDWTLPTPPALTAAEITAVCEWVRGGGALLFVADHMPFPGATAELAHAFGIEFMNGFAIDTAHWAPLRFRRSDGTLASHPISDGRDATERVDSVVTFWGQAFSPRSAEVRALLTFAPGVVSLNPDTAWRFSERTPTVPVGGWLQGATLRHGAGRVVVLGEAGMLSAQLAGERRTRMGMNAPAAGQNAQFTLNIVRWLAGLIPDG